MAHMGAPALGAAACADEAVFLSALEDQQRAWAREVESRKVVYGCR